MLKIQPAERCRTMQFSSDGYRLRGYLHLPAAENPPVIFGVHGLLSSSASAKQRRLASLGTAAGMAYFRFDHRGCGRSQGVFSEVTSLEARARDLLAAVRYVRKCSEPVGRIGLFGSSMGGAVCLSAARSIGADALVTYAAPLRSRSIGSAAAGIAPTTVSGPLPKPFDISGQIAGLRNILIFHGDADEVVPFSDACELYDHAAEPKRLVRQSGGDHPMSHGPHQEVFARETVRWFKTHLKP